MARNCRYMKLILFIYLKDFYLWQGKCPYFCLGIDRWLLEPDLSMMGRIILLFPVSLSSNFKNFLFYFKQKVVKL